MLFPNSHIFLSLKSNRTKILFSDFHINAPNDFYMIVSHISFSFSSIIDLFALEILTYSTLMYYFPWISEHCLLLLFIFSTSLVAPSQSPFTGCSSYPTLLTLVQPRALTLAHLSCVLALNTTYLLPTATFLLAA